MNWNDYPNFSEHEFACQCGCGAAMDPLFMRELQRIRTACDVGFVISSGYRCPDHNNRVSSTGKTGPHTTGKASDIAVYGERAFIVIREALRGSLVSGVGDRQKGPHDKRFVHLDILPAAPGRPRPWKWSY